MESHELRLMKFLRSSSNQSSRMTNHSPIVSVFSMIGIFIGCALLWVSPVTGIIPGMLFGAGGAILGGVVGKALTGES